MHTRTHIPEADRRFSVDTSFVLFFLAMDFGQSAPALGLDLMVSGTMLIGLAILPYFFPTESEKPDFQGWLVGRLVIAGLGMGLGLGLYQVLGVVLPEMFRFLPMTLLILTAMFSCYLQFYAMIRFRLAR